MRKNPDDWMVTIVVSGVLFGGFVGLMVFDGVGFAPIRAPVSVTERAVGRDVCTVSVLTDPNSFDDASVRVLCESGRVCQVMGHARGFPEYDGGDSVREWCRLCGQLHKFPIEWGPPTVDCVLAPNVTEWE